MALYVPGVHPVHELTVRYVYPMLQKQAASAVLAMGESIKEEHAAQAVIAVTGPNFAAGQFVHTAEPVALL